jgi:hypothetical protein
VGVVDGGLQKLFTKSFAQVPAKELSEAPSAIANRTELVLSNACTPLGALFTE